MQKHIGKIKNTGQKIVLPYMQLPQKARPCVGNCCRKSSYEDGKNLMTIVESQEGQGETVLANVLSRHLEADAGRISSGHCMMVGICAQCQSTNHDVSRTRKKHLN